MNTMPLCKPLDHIDNQELARLALLWKAQASSGQVEALGIAQALAIEQHQRLNSNISQKMTIRADAKYPAWWHRWQSMDLYIVCKNR
ncbi:MAG: hypothetical protein EOP14_03725 [Pseudomonas sp.]|nr:MAG: hypothetical protein EOP14_03725 [Pseudomonas sp.]